MCWQLSPSSDRVHILVILVHGRVHNPKVGIPTSMTDTKILTTQMMYGCRNSWKIKSHPSICTRVMCDFVSYEHTRRYCEYFMHYMHQVMWHKASRVWKKIGARSILTDFGSSSAYAWYTNMAQHPIFIDFRSSSSYAWGTHMAQTCTGFRFFLFFNKFVLEFFLHTQH
jgi:hypothetical protein